MIDGCCRSWPHFSALNKPKDKSSCSASPSKGWPFDKPISQIYGSLEKLYCHNLEMAHVDIRSFTSFSTEPSRLNISICVLTTRDYPWSVITSAAASPEIVSLSREEWQRHIFVKNWYFSNATSPASPGYLLSLDLPSFILCGSFVAAPSRSESAAAGCWPHKWCRSEHRELKVAFVGGGNGAYCGACNSKRVRMIKTKVMVESFLWFWLSFPGLLVCLSDPGWNHQQLPRLHLVHVNHDFHWAENTLLR